jgi:hypothetical protein
VTKEQKAAYVFSQAVCALAEIEAMRALNTYREMRGETIAYDDGPFFDVITKYGIDYNSVVSLFYQD